MIIDISKFKNIFERVHQTRFFFSIIYVIGLNIFINELKKSESLRISQLNLGEINSVSLILNSLDREIEMGVEMEWNNHFIIIFVG